MAEHSYKFNVTMTCGGCSGAVERVLKKLDGKPSSPYTFAPSSTLLPLFYRSPRPQDTQVLMFSRRQIIQRLPRRPDSRHRNGRRRQLRDRPRKDQEDRQDGELRER